MKFCDERIAKHPPRAEIQTEARFFRGTAVPAVIYAIVPVVINTVVPAVTCPATSAANPSGARSNQYVSGTDQSNGHSPGRGESCDIRFDPPRLLAARSDKWQPVKKGSPAPDFTLPDASGNPVSLSQFKDKQDVVLYFYPKDETSVCTKQAKGFRDNYEKFKDLGAEVIGISSDTVESHAKFAQNHKLPFVLVSDKDGIIRNEYGVPKSFGFLPGRVTYIIDKKGIVRGTFNSFVEGEKHITEALRILNNLKSKN